MAVWPAIAQHCPIWNIVRLSEKVASDLGLGGVFARYSSFLHNLQLASHELSSTWQKRDKNRFLKSHAKIN